MSCRWTFGHRSNLSGGSGVGIFFTGAIATGIAKIIQGLLEMGKMQKSKSLATDKVQ